VNKSRKENDNKELQLTHVDHKGQAKMVDVSEKKVTERRATARARVIMQPETLQMIKENRIKKGDVLSVARVAGIMAAKRTYELIPLCHPLQVNAVEVSFELDEEASCVEIHTTVKTSGRTGVEIEALTAASVAGLTIYDMCKAVDRAMTVSNIQLVSKSGGRSGNFRRQDRRAPKAT
jgi:cyclic pyranopterin phosphate synthase